MKGVYRLLLQAVLPTLMVITVGLSPLLEWFDRHLYDMANHYATQKVDADEVVLIDIDAETLERLGHWPIDRTYHAQAIDILEASQVGAIVYNIAFVETDPDNDSADRALITAVENSGRVVLPLIAEKSVELLPLGRPDLPGVLVGHADLASDSDQVLRRSFLYAGVSYPRWPSLALSALFSYAPIKADDYVGLRTPYLHVGFHDRWSRDYEVLLQPGIRNYFQTVSRFSFHALLNGTVRSEQLRDKAVFVGLRNDSLEENHLLGGALQLSSTEVQAYLFSSLHQGKVLSPSLPFWSISLGVYVVLFMLIASYQALPPWGRGAILLFVVFGAVMPVMFYKLGYWISCLPMLSGLLVLILQRVLSSQISRHKKALN